MTVARWMLALAGCGSGGGAPAAPAVEGASVANVLSPAEANEPPAFVNDEGRRACPVRGDVAGRHLREIGKLRGGTSDAPVCELPSATAPAAPAG